MGIKFSILTSDILRELYSVHGCTTKEIGVIVGLTESSILLKLKKLGLTSKDRAVKKDPPLDIEYTGKKNSLKKNLTKDLLENFSLSGHTDEQIGKLFGMTGEGVSYRRKKFGINASRDNKNTQELLRSVSKERIEEDYYSLNQEDFSKKYGVSRTVWKPYIISLGIKAKHADRIERYPSLTKEQVSLIIAGLLGDGSVSQGNYYYESHSLKQLTYLRAKSKILKPYSLPLYNTFVEPRLQTIRHPVFKDFYNRFYKEGVDGKYIPVDFIVSNWDDSIIAYWFFDDGSYDEASRSFWIANLCPIKEQLEELVSFIKNRYGWDITVRDGSGVYIVSFANSCRDSLVPILLKYATPDLFYKIPEVYLTNDMVKEVILDNGSIIRPKFYRVCTDEIKRKEIETIIFNKYRKSGFPFLNLSGDKCDYLLKKFKEVNTEVIDGAIKHNTSGMVLCENFFPNIYTCYRKGHKSPLKLWESDKYLLSLIRNRLKYADIISNSSMRTGIKLSQNSVSNFKPVLAKFLYNKYCFNDKVLDYCAGFGSRMLGAVSLGLEYTGYEPSSETYLNALKFKEYLSSRTSGVANIYNIPFEDADVKEDYYSFAFSSPPYYDFENYTGEGTQSIIKYSTFGEWIKGFWEKTIERSCLSLVKDGFFGVCYSCFLHQDVIKVTFDKCSELDFHLNQEFKALFPNVLKDGGRYERIFIFSKNKKNISYSYSSDINIEYTKKEDVVPDVIRHISRDPVPNFKWELVKSTFIKVSSSYGVSRDSYEENGIEGIPTHCIEYKYGGWNNFIKACGLVPQYEAETPNKIVSEYFKECLIQNKALSFYEYGKIRGANYTLKLKRLFNAGKKFSHFKENLFQVAVDTSKQDGFLKLFN